MQRRLRPTDRVRELDYRIALSTGRPVADITRIIRGQHPCGVALLVNSCDVFRHFSKDFFRNSKSEGACLKRRSSSSSPWRVTNRLVSRHSAKISFLLRFENFFPATSTGGS